MTDIDILDTNIEIESDKILYEEDFLYFRAWKNICLI